MIQYTNRGAKAYLALLLCHNGSVVPFAMPPAITSATLCLALALGHRQGGEDTVSDLFWAKHAFAIQIYSIVLGFMIVTRTNMALNRYTGALNSFQVMVSNWQDACTQICSFVNAHLEASDPLQVELMKWREQLAHWFSLMATFAVAELRGDEAGNLEYRETSTAHGDTKSAAGADFRIRTASLGMQHLHTPTTGGGMDFLRGLASPSSSASLGAGVGASVSRTTTQVMKIVSEFSPLRRSADSEWPHDVELLTSKRHLEYLGSCTPEERARLNRVHDKVLVVSGWICESISRAMLRNRPDAPEGPKLKIPPPVVTRVYQQLSNGMQAFHQALMVVIVPFPFPFAQMLSYLLLGFMILSPFLVLQLTRSVIFSPILTFIGVFGYFGTDSIAREIENPLGEDTNDLPVLRLHREYNNVIRELLLPLPHLAHLTEPPAHPSPSEPQAPSESVTSSVPLETSAERTGTGWPLPRSASGGPNHRTIL